jgi:hypothetical protein
MELEALEPSSFHAVRDISKLQSGSTGSSEGLAKRQSVRWPVEESCCQAQSMAAGGKLALIQVRAGQQALCHMQGLASSDAACFFSKVRSVPVGISPSELLGS